MENSNNSNSNNNHNNTSSIYDKLFILSKTYCYYCHSCNYSRELTNMKHTFTYNDIENNDTNDTNDIWNRMLEITRNRNNNNNYENNEINIGTYIYYTQSESSLCEFNLPISVQRAYLLSEFKKKYL